MPDTAPLIQELEQAVDNVAATADLTTVVAEADFAGTVTDVTYAPKADITGAASPNSRTFSLINKGQAGNGTTVVATLAMVGGVNALDFDEKAITLSATPADLVVAAGDVLAWTSVAVTGAGGLVDPGGLVKVQVTRS